MANLVCTKYGEKVETAHNVIFNCPALQAQHNISLRTLWREDLGDEQDSTVKRPQEIRDLMERVKGGCTISYKS